MSIDISVRVGKQSFTGWIQDYENNETIQKIKVEDGMSTFEMVFDDFKEWKEFIKLFNVSEITDVRKVNQDPIF